MSIKLFILRHGQPLSQEISESIPNSPLGKRGRIQATLVAEEIEKFGGADVLYSSTYRRALETAQPIYDKFKVDWHLWPALSETGRRHWPHLRELQHQGKQIGWNESMVDPIEDYRRNDKYSEEHFPLITEISFTYPNIKTTQPFYWPDAWWLPLEDEIRESAYERASKCIAAIRQRHMGVDNNIIMVCHGAFGSVLMTILTESVPCDHNKFSFAHAAFSCIELFEDGSTQVLISNHIAHLYPDYLTEY